MGLDLIKPSENECLLTKTKQQTIIYVPPLKSNH